MTEKKEKEGWEVFQAPNDLNSGYFKHTACIDRNKKQLFILGGENEEKSFSNTILLYELEDQKIVNLSKLIKKDLRIDSHTCIFYKGHFYVYGGFDSQIFLNKSRVYKFKVSPLSVENEIVFDDEFLSVEDQVESERAKNRYLNSKKDFPEPRVDHASAYVQTKDGENLMIIYGGRSKLDLNKVLGDCWSFDLDKCTWKRIGTFQERCHHCVAVKDHEVFFFGGRNQKKLYCSEVFKLETSNFTFKVVNCFNKEGLVIKREKCTMNYYKPSNTLIVSCGWCLGSSSNELIGFNLDKNEWKSLTTIGKDRIGHTSYIVDDELHIFGGKIGGLGKNTNEIVKVDLKKINF